MKTMLTGFLISAAAYGQSPAGTVQRLLDQQWEVQDTQGGRGGGAFTVVQRPEVGRPYSATITTQTKVTYMDGTNVTRTTTEMSWRDSDGRTRLELDAPNGRGGTTKSITIRDPVAGAIYMLNEEMKTATQRAASWAAASSVTVLQAPGARGGRGVAAGANTNGTQSTAARERNTTVEDLGTAAVNGVMARGTRTTTVVPAGAIGNDREFKSVEERWYSPELDMMVKTTSTDPRFGTTVREMTNIS